MTLYELRNLVKKGESETLEFKRKVAEPVKIVREVVAFANHKGGVLLIGVDDDGSIPGLKYADEDEFLLTHAIQQHCSPPVDYVVEKLNLTEKRQVLIFYVKQSLHKPVFLIYNFKKHVGCAYIRVNDRSIQSTREVRQVLKGRNNAEGILLNYGPHEALLMKHLAETPKIDVMQFAKIANIPAHIASKVLVNMAIANVLEVHPIEDGVYFTLKES
jgi:hypothetical protein